MYKEEMVITQECVCLEQDKDGIFIYSDSFTTMYGCGETPEEATQDYLDGIETCRKYDYEYECVPTVEGAWLWAKIREYEPAHQDGDRDD